MNTHVLRAESHKRAVGKEVYVLRPGGYWWGTITGLEGDQYFLVKDHEGGERVVSIHDIRYPDEEQIQQKAISKSTKKINR